MVPGTLASFSDSHRHLTYTRFIYIHASKTLTHEKVNLKSIFFLSLKGIGTEMVQQSKTLAGV